jgi:hypothetical protein
MIRKGSCDPQRISSHAPGATGVAARHPSVQILSVPDPEKGLPMTTFKFWLRPALFALFWMVVAAFTLSELATLPPGSGRTGQLSFAAAREAGLLRARTYATSRRVTVP